MLYTLTGYGFFPFLLHLVIYSAGAMMDERNKYWIFQGGRTRDYELLVYEDHRIVVPQSGRHALLQAAHAAAHQRMGSTRSLLERSFYWPNMQHDAYHFVQACRAVQAKKITFPGRQRPVLTPNANPEQTPAGTRRTLTWYTTPNPTSL